MPGAKTVDCGTCNTAITKTQGCISCKICSKWIHASCAKLSDKDLIALKAIKSSAFICASCEYNLTNRHDNDSIAGDVRNLSKKFDEFIISNKDEQNSIKLALDDIKGEVSACLSEIKSDITKCNDRINGVETVAFSKISNLEAGCNALHRRLNRADFLISGLPEGLDDLMAPVIAVAAKFNVDLAKHDINHVCYINGKRNILVKLNSVANRDKIMRQYFKTRTLRVCDIMGTTLSDITSRVYLNDHYTPAASFLNTICVKLRRLNIISKFKILNGDKATAKITLLDGKEIIRDIEGCNAILNGAAALS